MFQNDLDTRLKSGLLLLLPVLVLFAIACGLLLLLDALIPSSASPSSESSETPLRLMPTPESAQSFLTTPPSTEMLAQSQAESLGNITTILPQFPTPASSEMPLIGFPLGTPPPQPTSFVPDDALDATGTGFSRTLDMLTIDYQALYQIGLTPALSIPMRAGMVEWGIQINACDEPLIPALDEAKQMGFSWVKHQFRWADVEYLDDRTRRFRWDCSDALVQAAHERGLKVLFSVTTAPPYLRRHTGGQDGLGPPSDVRELGLLMNILLTRYRGRIHAIEIWNEPNLDAEWKEGVDPFRYTFMLKLAYAVIKQMDPSVMVILGGMAPLDRSDHPRYLSDIQFLEQVYELGGWLWTDCIGYHANGPPQVGFFDEVVQRYEQRVLNQQPRMLHRPLCLTEVSFSLPYHGQLPPDFSWASAHTEEEQAERFGRWIEHSRSVPFLRLAIVFNLNYRENGRVTPNSIAALSRPDLRGLTLEVIRKHLAAQ